MKAFAFLLICLAALGCSEKSPTLVNLPDAAGKSLRLEIYPSPDGKRPAASFNVTEPKSVNAILGILWQGVEQTDHKCADIGQAKITFADEQTVTIEILPGHETEYYEFRYQRKNHRVPRNAFLAALEKAGIDLSAIPKECH